MRSITIVRTLTPRAAAALCALTCGAALATSWAAGTAPPAAAQDGGRIRAIDLTHVLDERFPYIPVPGVTFPFKLTPIATLARDGVAANRWDIHEHIGTQIDAPSHFVSGGASLEALPADTLVAPLAVVDIRAKVERDPDSMLTVADLAAWEQAHGRLPDGAAVFVYSGWESRITDAARFINADATGTMHFPGIGPEAAAFLATERRVSGIGVDTLSIDPGVDKAFRTHRAWLGRGKWAVEVVANLANVPPSGATVFVGAPRIRDATGGPVRLIATVPATAPPPVALPDAVPGMRGFWEHERCQVQQRDGRRVGSRSVFSLLDREWGLAFTQYATDRCDVPLMTAVFRGTYEPTARSTTVPGAIDVTFAFSRKAVVVHDASFGERLGRECGGRSWRPGVEEDVTGTGCLWIEPLTVCPQEYDVVKLDGDRLYLGERPLAGRNLCAADRRPARLRSEPLVRR